MAENFTYSRVRGESQQFFLGTGKLLNVNNVSINNNFGTFPLNFLGRGYLPRSQIPNFEQSSDVSINSYLINSDPFISLTGAEPINMFILKDKNNINNNYCLISGYLNSYSARFGINQIPQVSTSLKFYKNSGPLLTGGLDSFSYGQLTGIRSNNYNLIESGLEIPYGASLNLTLDEYNTNRVQDFNIDINVKRIPIYNIGSRSPKRVDTIYPLDIRCFFTFEASDYSGIQLIDFPQRRKNQNILLGVSGQTGAAITSYNLSNMTLVNESIVNSIDNNQIITREYLQDNAPTNTSSSSSSCPVPAAWWKADAIVGKLNGEKLSGGWVDSSVFGNRPLYTGENAYHSPYVSFWNTIPTYVTNAINGLPAVNFNTSWFEVPAFMAASGADPGYTSGEMFMVIKADYNYDINTNHKGWMHLGGELNGYRYADDPAGNRPHCGFGSSARHLVDYDGPLDTWNILDISSAPNLWTFRVSGITVYENTTNTVAWTNSTPFAVPNVYGLGMIGRSVTLYDEHFFGDIAEIQFYSGVLSESCRAENLAYLRNKYAIT